MFAFVLHIGGGGIALLAGIVAVFARKGGRLHRRAGTVFFGAMLVMASFAAWLAVTVPGQIVNLIIAGFTTYLVTTAWMTVRRGPGAIGLPERIGLAVSLLICAPFVLLSLELALGLAPFIKSAVPLTGPIRIAIWAFTLVIVCAAIADARVVLAGGVAGASRIARHLWRMCLGLTLASGSAFTNGFARFLPGPYHVPTIFFLPQFLPLILMVYWLFRVRFSPWRGAAANPAEAQIAPSIAG
jgi:hypothetical protein